MELVSFVTLEMAGAWAARRLHNGEPAVAVFNVEPSLSINSNVALRR